MVNRFITSTEPSETRRSTIDGAIRASAMDWRDDEFEAFLRRFRPRSPRPLPTRRRPAIAFAAAAVIALAVVALMRYGPGGPAAPEPAATPAPAGSVTTANEIDPTAASPPSAPAALNEAPRVEKSAGAAAGSLTPPPLQGLTPLRPRSSNRAGGAGAGGRRLRFGFDGVLEPPLQLVRVNPIYPEEARAAGIEGVVILEILIAEDGTVTVTDVLRSVPELDEAAIDAVSQWVYEPTLLNGEPVELEVNVTVNFTLP